MRLMNDKTDQGVKGTGKRAATGRSSTAARKKSPAKRGRPTIYSDAVADKICELMAEGNSLRSICKMPAMPAMSTVMRWLASEERVAFREQYARARELLADYLAEETIEIADDGLNDTYVDDDGRVRVDHDHIARSRLRVDARKWFASKIAPKKYGDRITQEHTGADGAPLQVHSTVTFVQPPARPEDDA